MTELISIGDTLTDPEITSRDSWKTLGEFSINDEDFDKAREKSMGLLFKVQGTEDLEIFIEPGEDCWNFRIIRRS